jgi:uncharacterized protein (DUF952 family)
MTARAIYKLVTPAEWDAAQAEGIYRGSAHDARDGFIHFSTAEQLSETARRHFADVPDPVLLEVYVAALGPSCLRWEPSRGGDLFPHLYSHLELAAISWCGPYAAWQGHQRHES